MLLAIPAFSQEGAWNSACFRGLSDSDSPATIDPCDAQDLLNTESNLHGTAVLKRKGFQKSADLTVSTSAVTGSHSFIDASGNRLDIVCNDRQCFKSTNGNAFAVFLGTAASGVTRWSFVDVGGNLYGANSKRDPILKYDGTTLSYPLGMPLGTILEMTQDRMVVGDIASQPNRVHYSSAGAVEQYTTGVNPEDSFFDDIGSAGDKIRGLKYHNGNLYIFKTASLTSCELADQYNTRCSIRIPNLGTTDPASIVTAGSYLYFRAQDKNYWEIGPGGLRQISNKISTLVKSQSGGLSGGEITNVQTTQSDWDSGIQFPSSTWNTATIPGSIFTSSMVFTETAAADFNAGTKVNVSTNVNGALYVYTSTGLVFENAGAEKNNYSNWVLGGSGNCGVTNAFNPLTVDCAGTGGINPKFGTYLWSQCYGNDGNFKVRILDAGDGSTLKTTTIQATDLASQNVWYYQRINLADVSPSTGSIKIQIAYTPTAVGCNNAEATLTSSATVMGDYLPLWLMKGTFASNQPFTWDFDETIPQSTSGTYTSQCYDTTFSTPIWGPFTGTIISSVTTSSLTFQTQVSSTCSGTFDTAVTATDGSPITSLNKRVIKYIANYTLNSTTNAPAGFSLATLPSATTGQYETRCIQPGSSISAFGTLSCAQTLTGRGSVVFYSTSAATCGALPSGVPDSWVNTVTNNATLAIGTNTAVYVGFKSLLGSATDQAQIDSCVLNWVEGTLSQPSWAVYDSIKDAVYWTTAVDNAPYANRLLKYDRRLDSWYPWHLTAQAPKFINNNLYFGGSSSGTWNLFGTVDNDNGNAIDAFWKSKDVGGDAPFQEKNFRTLSLLNRNAGTGSLTATYTFSNAETGAYTVSLTTGTGISYSRYNENLPNTSPTNFVNIKVGNNSSVPFEVLGIGLTWEALPWSVGGP